MSWDDIDPDGAERAIMDKIANPPPPTPPVVSTWSKVGAFMRAPLEGAASAVNETARVVNAAGSYLDTAANSSARHDGPFESQRQRAQAKAADQARETDEQLRSGAEYWKPDPATATTASSVLFGASRVLTKAVGYSLVGGTPGMIVGTGVDEGVTTTQQLQDRGVDPSTAAKVGLVHGAVTAATVALPVAGRSMVETAGLVAAGGPGSFMAEQALSRHILEAAKYPDIAAEFDPFDKTGLVISAVIPAVVGAAAHTIRLRKGADTPAVPPAPAMPSPTPDVVDAAHVSYRNGTVDDAALVPHDDIAGMQAHHDTMVAAREQLDAGQPVDVVPTVQVDPVHASDRIAPVAQRFDEDMRTARDGDAPPASDAMRTLADVHSQIDDLATGRTTREALAQRADVTPETHSLRDALLHDPERYDAIADQLEDVPRGVSVRYAVDSAVSRTRTTDAPLLPARPELHADADMSRALQIASERPGLPVKLSAAPDAETMRASDYLEHMQAEAERDRNEARAYAAAVECFIARGA